MTNKEKFLTLVSNEKTSTLENAKERIRNRAMLRESQKIALKVLVKLDELGWSQKDLAREMKVKPQQVNKMVQGKVNFTIDTQIKLQDILNIPILATYYEKQFKEIEELILNFASSRIYEAEEMNQIQNLNNLYENSVHIYKKSEIEYKLPA